jgi:hypothetical protein
MLCQLRPLIYSLGLNIAPHISFTLEKSRIKTLWWVKQAVSRWKMAGAGFHSIAKLHAQIRNAVLADSGVFQADCHRENCRTADCYSQSLRGPNLRAECQRPECRVRIRRESGGWQSAVHLRADCQTVILIVANRGIGARSLALQWNPAPAILHRETACLIHHRFCQTVILFVENRGIGARSLAIQWNPAPVIFHRETACLIHHRFFTRDFTSVKLIRGAMFRLKLLSWHTISWHYTF